MKTELDQAVRRERNSTVEFLRLLAMLMVVANHFATHGGICLSVTGSEVTGKLFFSQMLACLGKLGVDVFVIISAWYLYGRPLTGRRILSLWLPVWFWGMVIYALSPWLGIRCGLKEFLLSAFPLTHNAYWFVTDLFVLTVLAPLVSKALEGLSVRTHGLYALGFVVFYSVIPTLLVFPGYSGRSYYGYSDLIWFVILFVLAAWLRRVEITNRIGLRGVLLSTVAAALAMSAYVYGCDLAAASGSRFWHWTLWRQMNSVPVLVIALGLVMLALKLPSFTSRVINFLAAGAYGVYLISDNRLLVRDLWVKWVDVPALYRSDNYYCRAIVAIVVVYFVSMLLSLVYVSLTRFVKRTQHKN